MVTRAHLVILHTKKSLFDLDCLQVHLLRLLVSLHGLVEPAEVAVVFGGLNVALPEGKFGEIESKEVEIEEYGQDEGTATISEDDLENQED